MHLVAFAQEGLTIVYLIEKEAGWSAAERWVPKMEFLRSTVSSKPQNHDPSKWKQTPETPQVMQVEGRNEETMPERKYAV